MKRKERHAQILEHLTGLKPDQGVTVRWVAKQMRMTGQRALVSKDIRELEKEGHVMIKGVLDVISESVGNYPRKRTQKILVVRLKVANEGNARGRGSR